MSGRYAQGNIAGVALVGPSDEPCRIDMIDAEGLRSTTTGVSVQALDFTVHTQLSGRGVKGVKFGVKVSFLPISKLLAIISAIETALSAGNDFAVVMSDAGAGSDKADDFDVRCVPDFATQAGRYYTRGALDNDFVKDVTFRFVTTGANE